MIGTAIVLPLVIFVLGPNMPPGKATRPVAKRQVTDNTVLLVVMTPFTVFILVYLGYAIWRLPGAEGEELRDGAPIRGHMPSQIAWLATTTAAVLFLAIFGTAELLADNGSGGGSGPNPVAKPSGAVLPVQVIAQQWEFTYRYPTYGGVETARARAAGRSGDRVPRDLARRGPLVLGVRARSEGRREPGRRQHRLREDDEARRRSRFAAPSSAASGTATCSTPGRVVSHCRLQVVDRSAAQAVRAGREVPAEVRADLHPRPDLPRRMSMRRLIGFNLLTAVVLGVVGFYVGWWLGHQITGPSIDYFDDTGQNDIALFVAYLVGVDRVPVGLGFANYPVQRLLGKPPSLREKETAGHSPATSASAPTTRLSGIQYLIGIGAFIFIGGLNAMLIRFELLRPHAPRVERQQLPHAGRAARHDDDGDDDERDPRPVRELPRAAHDRRAADGVPAHRGAHLLASDGSGDDPDDVVALRRLPDRLDRLRAA